MSIRQMLQKALDLEQFLFLDLGISVFLTYLSAKEAMGKTTILRLIARSVVTGEPFLGCVPTRVGKVYVVVTDAGEREAWARFLKDEQWAQDHVFLESEYPDALDPSYWRDLIPWLSDNGFALVILDNYRGLAGTVDTDKGHAVAETLGRFRPIYREFPTLLAIHSNNPQGEPAHSKDIRAEARGRWHMTGKKGGVLKVKSEPNHGPATEFRIKVTFGAQADCELVTSPSTVDTDDETQEKGRNRDQVKLANRLAIIRQLLPARQIDLARALAKDDPDISSVDSGKQAVRNLTGKVLVRGSDGLLRERAPGWS